MYVSIGFYEFLYRKVNNTKGNKNYYYYDIFILILFVFFMVIHSRGKGCLVKNNNHVIDVHCKIKDI